jgi:maleate isomerase
MIVPFDFVLDAECWLYVPDGASLHVTRLPHIALPYGVEHARALTSRDLLAAAAGSLTAIEPAVIVFSCTSASFVDGAAGERRVVADLLGAGARCARTTAGAFQEALVALGVRQLAIASPYPPELGVRLRSFVEEAGVAVAAQADRSLLDFEAVAASSPDEIAVWAVDIVRDAHADAVFLPGTNVPTIEMIEAVEERLGMPVITANQVTMWSALRAARIAPPPTVARQRLFAA